MAVVPAAWVTEPFVVPSYERTDDVRSTEELPDSMGWEKYRRPFRATKQKEDEPRDEWYARNDAEHKKYLEMRHALDPSIRLMEAIRSHQPTSKLDELLAQGASLYERDIYDGDPSLHLAVSCGNVQATQWLLENGVPWWIVDLSDACAIERDGDPACRKILMDWAIESDYARYYKPFRNGKLEGFPAHPADIILDNEDYLQQRCFYTHRRDRPGDDEEFVMVNDDGRSGSMGSHVMSTWETAIMKHSARLLMEGQLPGRRVLNIGFGLGIIDSELQSYHPATHVIIEAHPDAIAHFQKTNFPSRFLRPSSDGLGKMIEPDIRLVKGTWRDVLSDPERRAELGTFDAIYFDTFEEGYRSLLEFFSYVPGLMRGPGARMSFFAGLGRNDPVLAEVCKEVQTRHLNDLGLGTTWTDVEVLKKPEHPPDASDEGEHNRKPEIFVGEDGHLTNIVRRDHKQKAEMVMWPIPVCSPMPTVPRVVVPRAGGRFFGRDFTEGLVKDR